MELVLQSSRFIIEKVSPIFVISLGPDAVAGISIIGPRRAGESGAGFGNT